MDRSRDVSNVDWFDISSPNIKQELKSEIDVVEVDDSIFSQPFEHPHNSAYDWNIGHIGSNVGGALFGEATIEDEIVKEEPNFYDPINELQVEAQALAENLEQVKKSNYNSNGQKIKKSTKRMKEDQPRKSHLKTQHDKKLFECSKCLRKFSNQQWLDNHMRMHTNSKPFECDVCHRKFNYKLSLSVHQGMHSGIKPHQCDQCEMKYRLKQELQQHKKTHMNQTESTAQSSAIPEQSSKFRYHECYLCQFHGNKDVVKSHMKLKHTGEKLFNCDLCPRKIAHKHYPRKKPNEKTKNTASRVECKVCGKNVARNGLKVHMEVHGTPNTCRFCLKQFSTRHYLNVHLRIHAEYKPFECEYCKKTFIASCYLIRHIRVHTGEKPYECNVCQTKFSRKYILRDHIKAKH